MGCMNFPIGKNEALSQTDLKMSPKYKYTAPPAPWKLVMAPDNRPGARGGRPAPRVHPSNHTPGGAMVRHPKFFLGGVY